MNVDSLLLKKNTFISRLIFFCHRVHNGMHDNASVSFPATSTETSMFTCFINHTCEYSTTTKSSPIKATSDQNILVAMISCRDRKLDPLLASEKMLPLITEVFLCNFSLDSTFPGFRTWFPSREINRILNQTGTLGPAQPHFMWGILWKAVNKLCEFQFAYLKTGDNNHPLKQEQMRM